MTEIQALRLIIFAAPIIYYIIKKTRDDLRAYRAMKEADTIDFFDE